jgi:hypothetical protein
MTSLARLILEKIRADVTEILLQYFCKISAMSGS